MNVAPTYILTFKVLKEYSITINNADQYIHSKGLYQNFFSHQEINSAIRTHFYWHAVLHIEYLLWQ